MKLPTRSDAHIKESDSWKILQAKCPAEWIIREVSERDYGIDCYIELAFDNEVTGDLLSVQLKAVNTIEWRKINEGVKEVTFSGISTDTIHYWMNFPVPVFLCVADLADRNLYFAAVKQQVRSQYSKYLNQQSIGFTLTNIFKLGTDLGNNAFLTLYFKQKDYDTFISYVRMIFIHWRQYLEFIQGQQGADEVLGIELDDELMFIHLYETLYTLSRMLSLNWDIDKLSDIYKKDRELWKDSPYRLHSLTFTTVLPAMETKFFQIIDRVRIFLTEKEKEYWEHHDLILLMTAEELGYLKPGFKVY
jgi:hypothetical protein